MDNQVRSQEQVEPQVDDDPITRVIYAVGVVLTAFGSMLPGGGKWSMVGIAMIAFCYIYE
jgi:hypothetical protein